MDIQVKRRQLRDIYEDFEGKVDPFKKGALCKIGCTFCCTHFGNVDIVTLEGLIIHEWVDSLNVQERSDIRKKLTENKEMKAKGAISICPFLKTDNTCGIYNIRPFSCRQLYSLKNCTEQGPTIHRKAVELAKLTTKRLQQLDVTGYSGHVSYILHLLDKPVFRKLYMSGGFNPREIRSFGKKHGIIINRMISDT
ncbi:YkgJ family cysteine cluster protein [Thermodesulfobacteriota bacterium]